MQLGHPVGPLRQAQPHDGHVEPLVRLVARAMEHPRTTGAEGFADPLAMVRGSAIDAVVIAAETSLHADLVEQAAAAAKELVGPVAFAAIDGRGRATRA